MSNTGIPDSNAYGVPVIKLVARVPGWKGGRLVCQCRIFSNYRSSRQIQFRIVNMIKVVRECFLGDNDSDLCCLG